MRAKTLLNVRFIRSRLLVDYAPFRAHSSVG